MQRGKRWAEGPGSAATPSAHQPVRSVCLCGQGCGVRCPNRQKHHGTVEPGGGGWGRTWDKLRSCDSVTHTAREKVVRRRAPAQSRWPGEGRGRVDDRRPSKLRRPRSVFGVGFRERDGCGFLVTLQEERQEMATRGGRMKGRSEGEAGVGWVRSEVVGEGTGHAVTMTESSFRTVLRPSRGKHWSQGTRRTLVWGWPGGG